MKLTISEGQIYTHQDGDEYEVVKVTKDGVTLETSDNAFVLMDLHDLIEDIQNGVLTPRVEEEVEEEEDD